MAYIFQFIGRYRTGLLTGICFLLVQFVGAQANQDKQREKHANYSASKDVPAFNPKKPFYLISWNGHKPDSIRVFRQLDDSSAIIMIQSPEEMATLLKRGEIQAANDQWKLSPDLQVQIKKFNREQEYILTATSLEELIIIL